jgi:hypothetical protein
MPSRTHNNCTKKPHQYVGRRLGIIKSQPLMRLFKDMKKPQIAQLQRGAALYRLGVLWANIE